MATEETMIEIPEVEKVENTEKSSKYRVEDLKSDGVSPKEIELYRKHGLLDESEGYTKEVKKSEEPNTEVSAKEEEKPFDLDSLDSFDKVHNIYETAPEKFRELPKHVKALYHNSKGLYKKAKEEGQRRQEIESEYEFSKAKEKGAIDVLNKVAKMLEDPDSLTVEALEAIVKGEKKPPEDVFVTREELENKKKEEEGYAQIQRHIQDKVSEAEKLGKSLHPDFERYIDLAKEVGSKKPIYLDLLNNILLDKSKTESDIVDAVVDIAHLHPKFNDSKKSNSSSQQPPENNADRALRNANKAKTSASIGGGSGRKFVSEEELTSEDAVHMSITQWRKLSPETRRRLKGG